MICYLDTSALVKLYIKEAGSEMVRRKVELSSVIATSKFAYAETMAAFSRYRREGMPEEDFRRMVSSFRLDWPCYFSLAVSEAIILRAGELAQQYILRGFDAIHLASALSLSEYLASGELEVGCWDIRLWIAFQQAGLRLFPPDQPGKI